MARTTRILIGAAGVAVGAWLVRRARRRTREVPYLVALRYGDLEVRDYPPHLVAETTVGGDEAQALREGFRRLSRYLFGDNSGRGSLAELAPQGGRRGEHIEMTVPVRQTPDDGAWRVSLPLPARYTLESLPRPTDGRVVVRQVPAHRVAALRFKGVATPERVAAHSRELSHLIDRRLRKPLGPPTVARYDPPWRPPFLRHNEVLQEIR